MRRGFIVEIPWVLVIVFALLALAIAVLILFLALRPGRRSDDLAEAEDGGDPLKKRFCPYCGANVQQRERICSNCDEVL